MLKWKRESNYVTHESGFTVIVEEGSFNEPYLIKIKKSEGFSVIEQATLLREGMAFGLSKTHIYSRNTVPREHKMPQMTATNTRQKLTSEIAHLEKNAPIITIKKTRKAHMLIPAE